MIYKICVWVTRLLMLPEEAFMAWKDDMSDDVPPGKMDAIIATTSWFSYLEEES